MNEISPDYLQAKWFNFQKGEVRSEASAPQAGKAYLPHPPHGGGGGGQQGAGGGLKDVMFRHLNPRI